MVEGNLRKEVNDCRRKVNLIFEFSRSAQHVTTKKIPMVPEFWEPSRNLISLTGNSYARTSKS